VHNAAGDVVGSVVQAGAVHGDVHLHPTPLPLALVVPRQLPGAPGLFAGRAAELAGLERALTATTPDGRDAADADLHANPPVTGTTVVVSAIAGAGGIGKTWLALAWAHRHLDRFPDGQLFVDLHGFSLTEEPMASSVAVRRFLDALGVDLGRISTDLDAQAALYRSLIAEKRMLWCWTTPLRPSRSSRCIPVAWPAPCWSPAVQARFADRPAWRTPPTAEHPGPPWSHALLIARLDRARVAAETDAIDELCGATRQPCRSPPAVPPPAPLSHWRRPPGNCANWAWEVLDHDTYPAAGLPAVVLWSLRRLTDEQHTLFALLGITPGPTPPPAAAVLAGVPPSRARTALSVLEQASLLEWRSVGRYAMHDLIRAYTATRDLTDDTRSTALVRVMDFYLHRTCRRPAPGTPPPAPVPCALRSLPDCEAATTWLQAEHATPLVRQPPFAS